MQSKEWDFDDHSSSLLSLILRLRIGHTKFAKQWMVKNEEPLHCIACDVQLSVKHVLVECGNFYHERIRHFGPGGFTVKDLLGSEDVGSIKRVLDFFREIGLYSDI